MSDSAKMVGIAIESIVARRNHEPYVVVRKDGKTVMQLSMGEARKVAHDLLVQASRGEADAMIWKFFREHDLPEEGAAALMMEFRDFRLGFDLDSPEAFIEPPSFDPPKGTEG